MKKITQRIISVALIIAFIHTTLPLSVFASYCSHNDFKDYYNTSYYGRTKDKKHQIVHIYDRTCEDCGTIISEETSEEWESHSFNRNGECKCGYEKECEHEDYEDHYNDYSEYVDYTEDEHCIKHWYNRICNDCDEFIKETTSKEWESHSFNRNGECKCGYEKECEHKDYEDHYNDYSEYVDYTEDKHCIKHWYNRICSDCDEFIKETTKKEWESHSFNSSGKCKCGYEKECEHDDYTDYYNGKTEHIDHNNEEHWFYNYSDRICNNCGEYLKEVKQKEWQKHNVQNSGKCDCGYESEEYKEIQQVLEGKIYTTDNSGGIYLRTYDTETGLYDDIYKCHAINFNIPKNVILTKDGDNLYYNGEKICAIPSILLKADRAIYQIRELKKDIDPSYSKELDSLIADYQKVKLGKKSISSISNDLSKYQKLLEAETKPEVTYPELEIKDSKIILDENGKTVTISVEGNKNVKVITVYIKDTLGAYDVIHVQANEVEAKFNIPPSETTREYTVVIVAFGETNENYVRLEGTFTAHNRGTTGYIKDSAKQLVYGNFTEEVTLLGTVAQVGTGIIGIDLPMDIRDIGADLVNWKWTWGHAGQTALDLVAIVPVIGSIKYSDEAIVLAKAGKKASNVSQVAIKYVDDITGTLKYVDDVIENLDNVDNFAPGKLKHIFSGEVTNGKAKGFHYEGLENANGKVVSIVRGPNKYGVYEAKVEVNGKLKVTDSTFFPKEWTPQQVVDAINEAFDNKSLVEGRNVLYEGYSKSGMPIRMYVENGKITSAYPVYE